MVHGVVTVSKKTNYYCVIYTLPSKPRFMPNS